MVLKRGGGIKTYHMPSSLKLSVHDPGGDSTLPNIKGKKGKTGPRMHFAGKGISSIKASCKRIGMIARRGEKKNKKVAYIRTRAMKGEESAGEYTTYLD